MSAYTKHITQVSTDKDWQLDFDINITTPEEAFNLGENQSIINSLSNPVITFINNSGLNAAKLRGKCMNRIYVDDVFQIGISNSSSISTGSGTLANLDTGETTATGGYLSNFLPMGFDDLGDIIIEHNDEGNGRTVVKYLVTFSGDISYATHTKIEFVCDITLNHINIQSIPFTEMGDTTKEALVAGNVAIKTRIVVNNTNSGISTLSVDEGETSNTLVLTEQDAVKTWELNDERYVPNNGFVGQFVSRTLSGELHNISDDFNIENKDIELQMGIVQLGTQYQWLTTEDGQILIDEFGNRVYVKDLGEDITTWYTLGNFLVTKPEDDEVADNTKFEAFDYATKFNVDFKAGYVDANHTSSFSNELATNGVVTASWLADYTCAQAGVELATPVFTNSDFEITSNQLVSGESCRDVMKYISELAFGWCRIGWDNKCYIDEPTTVAMASNNTNLLTNDNYYSLTTQKQVFGPINRVVVGMSAVDGEDDADEDIDSIEANGLTEIAIMDNPFLYTAKLRRSFIEKSGRKLFGLTYTPLETETPGHPWFKGNELIDIQDMEGNDRYTYPFNRTINYTGHIKTKLVTPAPTEQEKTVAYNKTMYKTLRDVGIKVDKQEGLITILNSKTKASEDGLKALETRVETEITDTYSKTQIKEIISGTAEDGTAVSSVKTTAGTFDKNGLTIEQTGSLTKTNINSNGMIISNTSGTSEDDELLNVNSDGVDAKNVKVKKYLNIGSHSRMEDYRHVDGAEGTGVFWIGSD